MKTVSFERTSIRLRGKAPTVRPEARKPGNLLELGFGYMELDLDEKQTIWKSQMGSLQKTSHKLRKVECRSSSTTELSKKSEVIWTIVLGSEKTP